MSSDHVFTVTNAVPFRNGTMITGHWTGNHQVTKVQQGDILEVRQGDVRMGLLRYVGIVHVHYLHRADNPPYDLSVAYDGDYRELNGATLHKVQTSKSI